MYPNMRKYALIIISAPKWIYIIKVNHGRSELQLLYNKSKIRKIVGIVMHLPMDGWTYWRTYGLILFDSNLITDLNWPLLMFFDQQTKKASFRSALGQIKIVLSMDARHRTLSRTAAPGIPFCSPFAILFTISRFLLRFHWWFCDFAFWFALTCLDLCFHV